MKKQYIFLSTYETFWHKAVRVIIYEVVKTGVTFLVKFTCNGKDYQKSRFRSSANAEHWARKEIDKHIQ